MHPDMLVVWTEVVGDRPWLNHGVEIEGRIRGGGPSGPAEDHISIKDSDLIGRRRKMCNRNVEQVFLCPSHRCRAQGQVKHSRACEVCEIVPAAAIGAFGERYADIGLFQPLRDRRARQSELGCSIATGLPRKRRCRAFPWSLQRGQHQSSENREPAVAGDNSDCFAIVAPASMRAKQVQPGGARGRLDRRDRVEVFFSIAERFMHSRSHP